MNEEPNSSDILVDIPDGDLEELANMYRNRYYMPHASSLLKNGLRLKKQGYFFIKFISPRNCWRDDGTFFALMEFPSLYQLSIFTMDDSGKNVYEGMMETRRIDFRKKLEFEAIPHNVYSTVIRVIEQKKLTIQENNKNFIYTVPKVDAINYQIECPLHLKLAKLEVLHSHFINSLWPHKSPGSENYVSTLIETCGGYGLFLESSNELVSWVLKKKLGEIGLLQTVEHHMKKGLASIVVKKISKEIAEDGEDPTATVSVDNEASKKFFEKLQFKNLGWCYYIIVNDMD